MIGISEVASLMTLHSLPLITDGDIELDILDATLFPGIDSSIEVHSGFADAHSK